MTDAQAIPTRPIDVSDQQLDEFQQRFCKAPGGNLRLLAPAGSGKTQSLLWRCAELYRRADSKGRFLVVTFTRAARDELRARLSNPDFAFMASAVEVVTLNGWGFKRLRANHHSPRLLVSEFEKSGCVRNTLQPVWRKFPPIEKAMEAQPYVVDKILNGLIERLKSLGFDHEAPSIWAAHDQMDYLMRLGLLWQIQNLIDQLAECEILADKRLESFIEEVLPFWVDSCQTMIGQALFSLEDQKYVAFLDLRRQIAEDRFPTGGSRYTQVLVDEFQDINPLDLNLVRKIVDLHKADLTIVGDDDQAIFEWRGATPHYILQPDQHFDREFSTHILERNYRCPRNLVAASQKLIVNNKRREDKRVVAMQTVDAEVQIVRSDRFVESIDAVMDEVRSFLASNRPNAKLAILSRKRAQLIPYQVLMASEDLPFCAAEDLQIFMSGAFEKLRHALQTCAMARANFRPPALVDDIVKLCDLVKRYPLKKAEREALAAHLRTSRPKSYSDALDAIAAYRGSLKGLNEDGAAGLVFCRVLRDLLDAPTVRDAIAALGAGFAGLNQDYGKSQEDIFYTDPPFLYLAEFAGRYEDDFQRFIDDLDSARDTLARLPGEEDASGAADELWRRPVHLMTALRAKGKEYDTVIILDANDGIWPLRRAETAEAKESERRLFYVAMTRPKRRLMITLSGRIGDQPANPSPYLTEAGLL
ncbi:ATP-dependent helicase [Mesorhizobium sp. M0830]|uniref:ATP-dependent helicase n=1 Tax=Mesorhizobium sp. M0830 TaxID=2957008 RepID=UPI00333AC055